MQLLVIFVALSIVNVIFSTIKSITTIKSGKTVASLISGLYYAYYNIVLMYTVADFPMWQKCVITFACNLVGVWVVKYGEEKRRKDQLWKVEATVKAEENLAKHIKAELSRADLPCNYIEAGKYNIFNVFCATQKDSKTAKEILDKYNAKYFVTETEKF